MATPADLTLELFEAYGRGDMDRFAAGLADDLTAWVTNAEGGADSVHGRDAYMERVPDLAATGGALHVTQVLPIDEQRTLTMVEIRAEREGRTLHNHAAFLARFDGERIAELWMVDALPAYSDEFWS